MIKAFSPDRDYDTVCEWWVGHDWPTIPIGYLPSRGWIIPGIAAGFMYSTDSDVAWMEWVISNPKAPARDVVRGLRELIAHIKQEAKEDGYSAIFTALKHKNLEKLYETEGFNSTDSNMSLMVWRS